MAETKPVSMAWLRTPLARTLRPLLLRWPWIAGRKFMRQRLVPSSAQVPAGKVARLRRRLLVRMQAEPLYRELWLFGEITPAEVRCYRRFLERGESVVDAAAGFGWYTLEFATMVTKDGHVLAFEGDGTQAELAAENLRRNRVESWVTLKARTCGTHAAAPTLAAEVERAGGDPPVLCRIAAPESAARHLKSSEALLAGPKAPVLSFTAGPEELGDLEHYLRGIGYLAFWRVDPHAKAVEVGALPYDDRKRPKTILAAKANHADRLRAAAQ